MKAPANELFSLMQLTTSTKEEFLISIPPKPPETLRFSRRTKSTRRMDRAEVPDGVTLSAIYHPVLMLPFMQRLARPVTLDWQGGSIACHAGGMRVACEPGVNVVHDVTISGKTDQPLEHGPSALHAVDMNEEIWEALGRFAHRTYVPATEASRLKGAGAGLTDND